MGSKSRKRKVRWGLVVIYLLAVTCGILSGAYMANHPETIPLGVIERGLLAMIFSLVLATVLQIIIHEGGHMVFGLMTGYRFCSFRIASLIWMKRDGRMKCKRFSLMGTGGQCLMDPPDMAEGKLPCILYNLGGILMNLITAVLFMGLSFLVPRNSWAFEFLFSLAVVGVFSALSNGLPMSMGPIDNDGKNTISLLKNETARRCFWLQLKINARITEGTRIRDLPKEWFAMPAREALGNGICAAIGVFACDRAMDQQDFERAESIGRYMLEEAEGLLGIHRCLLMNNLLYCQLVGKGEREEIQRISEDKELKKYWRGSRKILSTIRTRYAYELLFQKDIEGAQRFLEEFQKAAAVYPYEGEIEGERELIARV